MISSSVLQSIMALNAESIKECQLSIQEAKIFRASNDGVISYKQHANYLLKFWKKRAKILERNQRAMKAALMEAYEEENFQRVVESLTENFVKFYDRLKG